MINWKIRFKNPQFYFQLAVAIFVPIFAYAGITAQDISSWDILIKLLADALSNPWLLATIVMSVYNAILDPTTTGIKDSKQALSYNQPKDTK